MVQPHQKLKKPTYTFSITKLVAEKLLRAMELITFDQVEQV
jgi:hypothetical protein